MTAPFFSRLCRDDRYLLRYEKPWTHGLDKEKNWAVPDPIEEFLSNYPEAVRRIIGELRRMVRSTMSRAHEFLYYDAINYSIDDSPLGRICYISPMEKYVTLGFLFGAQLDDQHHLLRGSGKRARHVKIRTLEEAKSPALKDLVKAAWIHGADSVSKVKRKLRQHAAAP